MQQTPTAMKTQRSSRLKSVAKEAAMKTNPRDSDRRGSNSSTHPGSSLVAELRAREWAEGNED